MISCHTNMCENTRSWLTVVLTLSCAVQVLSGEKAYSQSLLKFKDSLINANVLDDWKEPVENLCTWDTPTWKGCLCMNGSMVGLRLEGMGLGGKLDVNSLSEVPIVSLSLMNNNFTGPFPSGINKLGKLRSLFLANNSFSGEIRDDAFTGMYALRKLVLGDNFFTGKIPMSLLGLPKLADLEIQNNGFDGRIPDFWQPNLTVDFSNNKLSGAVPAMLQNHSASSFSGNKNLCGKPLAPCKSKQSIHRIAYIVAAGVGFALAVCIIFLTYRKHKRTSNRFKVEEKNKRRAKSYKSNENGKLYFVRKDMGRFELEELLRSSAEVLGSDSLGSSYKAALHSGENYVVRRFKQMTNVGREEFFEHMRRLGKLSHRNLLPLVAFYYRDDEKFLITSFSKNGSLASNLHDKRSTNQTALDWPTRLRIIKGVARGLSYLHNELPTLTLPHGHLKSSNILLDTAYEPLLSDYALAPLINKDQAPQLMAAYKSPESKQNSRVSRKTDVWSLGILILEVITGRVPHGRGRSADLATWVGSVVREEWSGEVFDKDMNVGRRWEGAMLRMLKIGMCCCDSNVGRRWELGEAVGKIEEVKERDGEKYGEDEYSSYVSEGDLYSSSRMMTDDDFSLSKI